MSKRSTSQRITEDDKGSALESIEYAEGHLSDIDGTMFGEEVDKLIGAVNTALANLQQELEDIEAEPDQD
jgi:hypothetical protein